MQHNIPLEGLDGQGRVMAKAIESCVHCGFCLPVCPTYKVLGEEMDSPRGRIILMKSVLEGELTVEESAPYIDRCLGCQGCVTACPSGVPYGDLITAYRAYAETRRSRPAMKTLQRGAGATDVALRRALPRGRHIGAVGAAHAGHPAR